MKKSNQISSNNFWQPKFWPVWLVYGLLQVVVRLPFNWQIRLGAGLGNLAHNLAKNRRHIAEVNIQLCFPDLSALQRRTQVREIFRSTGIGMIETANAWLLDANTLAARVDIQGLEHLEAAKAKGKGVLLLGMHFSTLDYCGASLATAFPFDVMYRYNKNPLIEHLMTAGRKKNYPAAIERSDIRTVMKRLKKGHAVWYGPDQDYGFKHSVFVPFFGVEAATIKATARIARICDCPVVMFSHRRDADNRYVIELSKPLENYPSENDEADARLINSQLEAAILKAPDQYWWIHRRFKTRPVGQIRPY